MTDNEYLKTRTIAEICDEDTSTVRRWIRQGLLDAKKNQANGRLYVPREEWERFHEEHIAPRQSGEFIDATSADDDPAPEDGDGSAIEVTDPSGEPEQDRAGQAQEPPPSTGNDDPEPNEGDDTEWMW